MSRLISLLNEKKEKPPEPDGATINGKQHVFHSEAGNLFRILLILSPDHSTTPVAGSTTINKMLPTQFKSKEKAIKSEFEKLKIEFNKLVVKLKKGQKRKRINKKNFYSSLFKLLKPFLIDNFKIGPLVNTFINDNINLQRKAIVLIGKTLLLNKKVIINKIEYDLTTQDISLITDYVTNLEPLIDDEEENEPIDNTVKTDDTTDTEETHFITPPEPPKEKTTNKIEDSISKVSDERLDDLHQKSGIIMKKVDELQIDNTEEMSNIFETNESPERFKVKLTGNDEAVTDIVNKKIEESFIKVKNKMGLQMANFTSQMASDFFKTMDGKLNGYINAFSDKITIEVEEAPEGIRCKTVISADTDTNRERFKIDQVFKNGTNEVYLNEVQVPQSAEKMGIFKTLFKKHLESYKAAGIEKISLTANEDVGGYAWFRFGFVPVNQEEIKGIARWIINVAPKVSNVLQYDQVAIGEHLDKCSKTKTTGIKNLVDYLKNEDIHYTKKQPVIISLLEKCSEEFEKTFDGTLSKKEISEYIAYKNFSDITVVGYDGPLAISYKALFKIQGLNDETGARLIPMLGVHLNWKGDLDLNDMAITNAYLNLK